MNCDHNNGKNQHYLTTTTGRKLVDEEIATTTTTATPTPTKLSPTSPAPNRRFWEQEPAKSEVPAVLTGMGLFVFMCVSLGLWHGLKHNYCRRTRHQTAPQPSPEDPIVLQRLSSHATTVSEVESEE